MSTAGNFLRLPPRNFVLNALDYFGFSILPQTPVLEVLSNDDNSREETVALNGAMAVTRRLPGRYPCTVQALRLQLPPASGVQPPANPLLLLDRTLTIPTLPESGIA